jgi:hypothetical protein
MSLTYHKGFKPGGGWGALRHYEVLANGCIPYFPDIKLIPQSTIIHFPKNIIEEANSVYQQMPTDYDKLGELNLRLIEYTKSYLTTSYQALYILSYTCLKS